MRTGGNMLMKMAKELEEETGLQPYVHFAPPCSTYSQARFPKIRSSSHPGGLPTQEVTAHDRAVLKYANTVTRNTFAVMSELSDAGYMVSLEQPAINLMLKHNIFKSWAHKSGTVPVIVDDGQFGMPYRKRTAVWCAPGPLLAGLERKGPGCSGGHQHAASLSSWDRKHERRAPTSHGCSAYPAQLCTEWVRVFNRFNSPDGATTGACTLIGARG